MKKLNDDWTLFLILCLIAIAILTSCATPVQERKLHLYERTLDLTDANTGFTAWKLSKQTFKSDTGINDSARTKATSYLHAYSLDTAYLNNNDDKVW